MTFHPHRLCVPPPPLVRAGGVRQGQKFRIFWDDQKNFFWTRKKVKILFFQNRLLKRVLGVWFLEKNPQQRWPGSWRAFSTPLPGGDPPRSPSSDVERTGPPSSDFFGKKIQLGEKNGKKNIFSTFLPYCILTVWDLY